jgi:S-(hydroxymethyl)glutathione dehydrogenase/alcohol dehydrogenase
VVRIGAAGVCHSDLHVINGDLPMPLPCVLGHEGAGVVEAVGAGVTRVAPGDHVVLNWVPLLRQLLVLHLRTHVPVRDRVT